MTLAGTLIGHCTAAISAVARKSKATLFASSIEMRVLSVVMLVCAAFEANAFSLPMTPAVRAATPVRATSPLAMARAAPAKKPVKKVAPKKAAKAAAKKPVKQVVAARRGSTAAELKATRERKTFFGKDARSERQSFFKTAASTADVRRGRTPTTAKRGAGGTSSSSGSAASTKKSASQIFEELAAPLYMPDRVQRQRPDLVDKYKK